MATTTPCGDEEYGVLESWNKLFVVPLERVAVCIGFTMYGSFLICCVQTNNQENKFVLVGTRTLHDKDSDIQHQSCVATFMESLALLDGANTVACKLEVNSLVVWVKFPLVVGMIVFIPCLQYPFCGYYILVYDTSLWMFVVHKPRFGNVNKKQYFANIILICLCVTVVVLKRSRL